MQFGVSKVVGREHSGMHRVLMEAVREQRPL
jgi:hypothetical protein